MQTVSYSEACKNLKAVIDKVVADRAPLAITRQRGEGVVMISASEWAGMEETLDLLASPAAFWPSLDSNVWKTDQHLAIAVTLWFPNLVFQHRAVRAASEFAQTSLADARGLCVQLVAHSPARISHGGDFHVHLIASARTAGADGAGTFARDLLGHGGQTLLYREWQGFLANLPNQVRP